MLGILSGTAVSQFEATFFMACYSFLFPHSIGAPDLKYRDRDRRPEGDRAAPMVDFSDDWSKTIIQRAEAQCRRDLTLPFSLWNLVFRTVVNIGSNLYAISQVATKEGDNAEQKIDASVFRDAAITVLQALGDRYTWAGTSLAVDGDLQKTKHTAAVKSNPVAQRMVNSMQATFRKIEGTQEIRSLMRHDVTGYCVMMGMPIMVTFAPNEKNSTLMIRLSRTRRSDPMSKHDHHNISKWGGLYAPDLVEHPMYPEGCTVGEEVEVPMQDLLDILPTSDARRKIVARDPLACVYGFNMLCKVALSALFGVRVCPNCPDCNMSQTGGCVDEFGSVALSEGKCEGWGDVW